MKDILADQQTKPPQHLYPSFTHATVLVQLDIVDDLIDIGYFSQPPPYLSDNLDEQEEEIDSTTSPESAPSVPPNYNTKELEGPSIQQQKKTTKKNDKKTVKTTQNYPHLM